MISDQLSQQSVLDSEFWLQMSVILKKNKNKKHYCQVLDLFENFCHTTLKPPSPCKWPSEVIKNDKALIRATEYI